MDVLADFKLSFLILKAEVQLGEEDREVLVGEQKVIDLKQSSPTG